MLEIFKKSGSMLVLTGALTLGAGLMAFAGCSGGTSDDDDDATEEASPTPTATPAPQTVTVTFTADTTSMADGANKLAEVTGNNKVYMVGGFNGWDPQNPDTAMYDDGTHGDAAAGDGIYTFQVTFPYTSPDGGTTWNIGDSGFDYKFAMTTDDAADAWGNGVKDVFMIDGTHVCGNDPTTTSTYGLFEFQSNLTLTVPDSDTTVDYTVPAWRDYAADTYGLPVCT